MSPRRLLLLMILLLPAAPAMAQPWWGDRGLRQREYDMHREDEFRRRHAAQRYAPWNDGHERGLWEQRRRAELRGEWEGRGRR